MNKDENSLEIKHIITQLVYQQSIRYVRVGFWLTGVGRSDIIFVPKLPNGAFRTYDADQKNSLDKEGHSLLNAL